MRGFYTVIDANAFIAGKSAVQGELCIRAYAGCDNHGITGELPATAQADSLHPAMAYNACDAVTQLDINTVSLDQFL